MKKLVSVLLCMAMIVCLLAGCASGGKETAQTASTGEGYKVALITMDSIDQHWITLKEGAEKAASELGVELVFMAPNTKDDAQQIEQVNNAVAGGCDAIIVAANGPDAISSALNEASAAGVKIVYVDSPANVPAEATFSTDNTAAGTTAGQTMLDELSAKGITSGKIGIVNVNAATASTVAREAGFRAAFDGTDFELLETQYGEGDAAKSQAIAENYITQGVVGIFGCNEGSTNGAGNAVKAAGADVVCVGFDKSDAILGLIDDGYILATMAQNPDVMGYEGVKAAVAALNGENLGGAGGFNFGMRWAVEVGYAFVWVMDDDCFPEPVALEKLLDADRLLQGEYGWLSSVALWTDGRECRMNRPKIKKNFYDRIELLRDGILLAEQATFVSLFLKAETIHAVGLPVKEFFIWGDDIEYTRRITIREKMPCYVVGQSRVIHAMKNNSGSNLAVDSVERLGRYKLAFRNEAYIYRREGAKGIAYYIAKRGRDFLWVLTRAKDHRLKRLGVLLCGVGKGLAFYPKQERI